MRRVLVLTCNLLYCIHSSSQTLTLSGTIVGKCSDSVELNMPFSESYFKENSNFQMPDAKGNFRFSLDGNTPRIVLLRYCGREQWVLLSPQRPLHVSIEGNDPNAICRFTGKAGPENLLLRNMKLNEDLFFVKELTIVDGKSNNLYVSWSLDSVISVLLPAVMQRLDSTQQYLDKLSLPIVVKRALVLELKYYYANQFYKFCNAWRGRQYRLGYGKKSDGDYYNRLSLAELKSFGLPNEDEFTVSESAKVWLGLRGYAEIKYERLYYQSKIDPDTRHGENVFGDSIGMTPVEEAKLRQAYGDGYVFAIHRSRVMPSYAAASWIADNLFEVCDKVKDPILASNLRQYLLTNFPDNGYADISEKKIDALLRLKEQNMKNPHIHVNRTHKAISSLKDLVAPYSGKVIFVDIWGTWCYPCIREFKYMPALKEHFKNSNLVYLYIDRDEDANDELWKSYVYIHNMTGEHVRMTGAQMNELWHELAPGSSKQGYPHYCIIDKNGNLAVDDAKRPSSGDVLFDQLDSVLSR